MQDKSNYSNPNKPQISKGLQDFINAMVEEIVLKGEAFDEQKKKWLKKYSEAEGLNYADIEEILDILFQLILNANDIAKKKYEIEQYQELILRAEETADSHVINRCIKGIKILDEKISSHLQTFNECLTKFINLIIK